MARKPKPNDPFRWFDSSPEVIQLVVMLYVRYPLSLRNVEDLAFERGIDICHETVRKWVQATASPALTAPNGDEFRVGLTAPYAPMDPKAAESFAASWTISAPTAVSTSSVKREAGPKITREPSTLSPE